MKILLLSMLVLTSIFSGCGHKPAPFIPTDAQYEQHSAAQLNDSPNQAILQVLIIYGSSSCNHVALRVYSPQQGSIFWDPAGYYGIQGSQSAERKNDILVEDAPTLNQYVSFRTETEFPSKIMEIFEWHIKPSKANQLRKILLKGSEPVIFGKGIFSTKSTGLYCGADISNFLSQATKDIMTIEQTFFPHDLEKQLYTQKPDRVVLIIFNNPITIQKILLNTKQP